jgi:hypothetical protein
VSARPMSPPVLDQLHSTYEHMAPFYRPAAPSDGFGHISVPIEKLDLDAECDKYAQRWWQEEDSLSFFIGCCNFPTRPATVYAIEAARLMCGGDYVVALRLLSLAVQELQAVRPQRRTAE